MCELVCYGFEHSSVNAALIDVVSKAYPDEHIVFYGEKEHNALIEARISTDNHKVSFETITLPHRNANIDIRAVFDKAIINDILSIALSHHVKYVIFTCTTLISIRLLRDKISQGLGNIKIITVLHGILESILNEKNYWFFNKNNQFKNELLKNNSDALSFLLLGPSIKKQLVELYPQLSRYCICIDHPYHYNPEFCHTPFKKKVISFGALGVLRKVKGSDKFFKLAKEMSNKKMQYSPQFVCVGKVVDKKLRKFIHNDVNVVSPDFALSSEEFERYVKQIDYAVFLHNPDSYRLTASGVLFDALSYGKPIIALDSPFFRYYFDLLGDIGYLCKNYDELKNTLIDLCKGNRLDEYEKQRKVIYQNRSMIDISILADKLRLQLMN